MKEEEVVKSQLSTLLRLQYPNVIFRFDIGADIRLPIGLATKSKKMHKHERGYPDLFIAEPRGEYCGMFLELKKDKDEVYTKKGQLRNTEHVREQWAFIQRLRDKGYYANWGLGFEDAEIQINKYLKPMRQ